MVLFCASIVVCLPSPYILGLHLCSPPIKHHRRFYPPPFRLQPHHPPEPLTPPSTVKVHDVESDIDALCVGPWFASLTEILAKRVEVLDIQCGKDAKVRLMRFMSEGISVDLPYAQLQVTTVLEVTLTFVFSSFLRLAYLK
ncbi:putative polynucleotide adenylyltransferase [Helianthus anomalus]